MSDPDLEALKSFYGRIIRETMPPEPVIFVQPYVQSDIEFCLATKESFFEKDRRHYYHEKLLELRQEEARVRPYLANSLSGEQWPEDFEPFFCTKNPDHQELCEEEPDE